MCLVIFGDAIVVFGGLEVMVVFLFLDPSLFGVSIGFVGFWMFCGVLCLRFYSGFWDVLWWLRLWWFCAVLDKLRMVQGR